MTPRRPRVLIISLDPVGEQMAGLGIRCSELARVLAAHADVTLAAAGENAGHVEGVATIAFLPHSPTALRRPIADADLVLTQPQWPVITAWLARSRARVVFDLYDPETFETLELFAGRRPAKRRLMADVTVDRLLDAFRVGDHFICASETQRDLWIGAMLAARRMAPARYDTDPTFREVIDVVPFGVPPAPPSRTAGGVRARFPQIGADDEIVLWNGGLWRWLDAVGAVRAMALIADRRPQARLVFMGAASNPAADEATAEARELARQCGLLERTVFFNDRWVPYADRAAWLLDADCSLSLHHDHLETRYAFRTRLLDCFWAGLPVVCTAGDDLSQRVERDDLGVTVLPGDHEGAATAIERVLDRGKERYAPGLAAVAAEHAWPRVAQPLVRWIAEPAPRSTGRAAPRALGHRARAAAYVAGHRVLSRRHGA